MIDNKPFIDPNPPRHFTPDRWYSLTLERIEDSDYAGRPTWEWFFSAPDTELELRAYSGRGTGISYDGTPSKARRWFTALADGRSLEDFAGPADFHCLAMWAFVAKRPSRTGGSAFVITAARTLSEGAPAAQKETGEGW